MADNVTVDNGSLTDYTTATDDVAGVQFQKVKLDVGGDGVSTPVEGKMPVGGDVAHAAVDSGNPVKIGGKAVDADTITGVAFGDRVDAAYDTYGTAFVAPAFASSAGDGSTAQGAVLAVQTGTTITDGGGVQFVRQQVYNGATWDRLRGDTLGIHVSRSATAATATLSNVAGSVTSVQLLALNTNRKGASIQNDSTAILYVKFGTTASTTSYTVKMAADAHYEVPFGFTGRIDGIWAAANGNARITEMS